MKDAMIVTEDGTTERPSRITPMVVEVNKDQPLDNRVVYEAYQDCTIEQAALTFFEKYKYVPSMVRKLRTIWFFPTDRGLSR